MRPVLPAYFNNTQLFSLMVGSPNSLLSTFQLYIHLFFSFLESYIWYMFRGFRTAHFETQIWIIKLMEFNTSTLGMWEALNY